VALAAMMEGPLLHSIVPLAFEIVARPMQGGDKSKFDRVQSAFRARPNSVCVRDGLAGWGGRTRTTALRNQNPRPGLPVPARRA
jgi:hypothetical protein